MSRVDVPTSGIIRPCRPAASQGSELGAPGILLVEDEPCVSDPLAQHLSTEGFAVACASSIGEARERIRENPGVLLLDWMLPDGQGVDWLREIREMGSRVPVIFLTARADIVDRVVGLELGADDYVTKPFQPRELVARIRAVLRRSVPAAELQAKPVDEPRLVIDSRARETRFQGTLVTLTRTEFDLLRALVENPGRVFSREELLREVWGYERAPTTRTVDTHVLQLRQKLAPELIETAHGIGYRYRG